MAKKRHKAEEIITKLREVEITDEHMRKCLAIRVGRKPKPMM